jgi:hypothetical protein
VAYELTGAALRALAQGRTADPAEGAGAGPLDDPAVTEALRALLTAEPDVVAAHLAAGGADTDGTLALALAPDAPAPAVARRLAGALAADESLRSRLVRGLDLAVLPPGSTLPGTALYRR